MTTKLYIKYETSISGYWSMNQTIITNELFLLELLFWSFSPTSYKVINVESEEDNDQIVNIYFRSDKDENDIVPDDQILKLTYKNYQYIKEKWNNAVKQLPTYIILSLNENNWIDLETKTNCPQMI